MRTLAKEHGVEIDFSQGYHTESAEHERLRTEAVAAARSADTVIVFAGNIPKCTSIPMQREDRMRGCKRDHVQDEVAGRGGHEEGSGDVVGLNRNGYQFAYKTRKQSFGGTATAASTSTSTGGASSWPSTD
jgi:hypothetical protein